MASLYKLTDKYAELISALECAETEEETAAIWHRLDMMEDDIVDKAEIYARIIRNKQSEAAALKEEKLRLEKRQKAAENISENLKQRLLNSMQRIGVKEIQTGIGKWRIQLNPFHVNVLDESAVPEQFRIPQPDKIDRTALLNHFKETGELLDGVAFVREPGLRFR